MYFCSAFLIHIGMTARIQMVFGLLLILLGGLIYLSFRPTTLLLFHALDRMGLMLLITDWRAWMSAYQPTEFVLYSLPGGLWAAAYILIILSLTGRAPLTQRVTIASMIPLAGIASELLQWGNLLPGIFDATDLLCYTLPLLFLIIYVIIKNIRIWQVFSTASVVSN